MIVLLWAMDMKDIKTEVDLVVAGLRKTKTDEEFIEAVKPALPALVRGKPSAYMSAVYLVGLAEEIVLNLHDSDDLLDFGKYLERSADSVKRCAMTSNLSNGNTPARSND